MRSWNTFGAWTSHGHIQPHKTHHNPNLETTFPIILFFVINHGGYIQMSFCPKSPKIPKIGILGTLEGHNFLWRPSIEVKYREKLYPLLRILQRYVACHFHTRI